MRDYCVKCDFKKDKSCGKDGKTCALLEPYLAQDTKGEDVKKKKSGETVFFGDRRETPISQMGRADWDDCWSIDSFGEDAIEEGFEKLRRVMPKTFAMYFARTFFKMSFEEVADYFDYNSADAAKRAFHLVEGQVKQAVEVLEDTKWLQIVEGGLKEQERLPTAFLDWLLANTIKKPLTQIEKMLGRSQGQYPQSVRHMQKRLRESEGILITANDDDTLEVTFQGERNRRFTLPVNPDLQTQISMN